MLWHLQHQRISKRFFFGDFNDQPIPSNYYNFLNDDDDDVNNVPGTPVDNVLLDNKVVEDAVVPNYEDINDDIIIDDDDSLTSDIDPPKNEILEMEGVDNETEVMYIEGMDSETEVVDNEVLPHDKKRISST